MYLLSLFIIHYSLIIYIFHHFIILLLSIVILVWSFLCFFSLFSFSFAFFSPFFWLWFQIAHASRAHVLKPGIDRVFFTFDSPNVISSSLHLSGHSAHEMASDVNALWDSQCWIGFVINKRFFLIIWVYLFPSLKTSLSHWRNHRDRKDKEWKEWSGRVSGREAFSAWYKKHRFIRLLLLNWEIEKILNIVV